MRGEAAEDRADVFALGVIAYQALTGTVPRGDATADRRPETPKELATLVDQMLAPDRFDRPTAAEIRADVDWLVSALEVELDGPTSSASSSSTTLRIRRPRWTPPIPSYVAGQTPIAGEIVGKPKR
jgi:serine/threonine protein kinase